VLKGSRESRRFEWARIRVFRKLLQMNNRDSVYVATEPQRWSDCVYSVNLGKHAIVHDSQVLNQETFPAV
jgi:hypothetical protein